MIPQPSFLDEHSVLITSERAKLDCNRNTSEFCNPESFIHKAVLTSAWNSSNINNEQACCSSLITAFPNQMYFLIALQTGTNRSYPPTHLYI